MFEERKYFQAFRDVNQAVIVGRELDEILNLILTKGLELTGFSLGLLGLITPEGGINCIACQGLSPISLEPEQSLARRVLETGTAMNVPDVRKESTYVPAHNVMSELIVPLKFNDVVIGLLDIASMDINAFTTSHEELLSVFADEAAIAIQNAKLIRRLTILHNVGQVVNSILDLEKLTEKLYEQIRKIIPADIFSVLRYGEGRDTLRGYIIDDGKSYEKTDIAIGNLSKWVIDNQKPIFIRNSSKETPPVDPTVLSTGTGRLPASYIIIPLIGQRSNTIGVISVQSYYPNAFDDIDQQTLSILAVQAAVAIENARHYTRRVAELEALSQIDQLILLAASEADTDKLLDHLLKKAFEFTNARFGNILLYDHTSQELIVKADVGSAEKFWHARQKLGEGITGWVAKERKPCLVSDISQDSRYVGFIPGMQSELAVPLLHLNDLVGVLNVESPEINAFNDDDLRLLLTLAGQSVIALQYTQQKTSLAQQQEDLRRENVKLEALIEINQKLSSTLNVKEVLHTILDWARELLGAVQGNVMLLDEATGELRMEAERGVAEKYKGARQMVGEGIVGGVAKTRKSLNVADVKAPPWIDTYIPFIPNARSELAVPMIHPEGRLLGVLNIESSFVGAFKEKDEKLLVALATQASIAVQNAERQQQEVALQSMAVLGDSAFEVAHRLSGIMGLINDSVDNTRIELEGYSGEVKRSLDDIGRHVSIIVSLCERLLGEVRSHKHPSAQTKAIITSRAIISSTRLTYPTINVEIIENCMDTTLAVFADDRIFGAFANIFSNAVESLPQHGPRRIELGARPAGPMVEFWISDTGHGILTEDLNRIFHLFFTKGKHRGLGFGLWSAKWRIVANRGAIDVKSKIGEGTTFTIQLPRAVEVKADEIS